ncbi:hypothetical protein V1Y59_12040 [Gordonia sp. PKS22-38]|uniref:Pilus assembly protein n=1 Tax=Gordonia prachuapensis TaxID=3115651 RepID=A0ABU7MTZ8_9ACTN|nr:hypothetical protein [Gordonia sp. PKS22-38]
MLIITFVVVGAVVAVLAFLYQPSIDFARYEQRQAIATRDRTRRRLARQQARATARAATAEETQRTARETQPGSRAWLFDFATQLRSFI